MRGSRRRGGSRNYSRLKGHRIASACAAALMYAIAPSTQDARADYVFTGPDDEQWTVASHWTLANATADTVTPIAFYPGGVGTDLAQTTNVNSHAVDGSPHV